MWLLPTWRRPTECAGLIAAMRAVDDVPPVAVMIDEDTGLYDAIEWPASWQIHRSPDRLELTCAINTLRDLHAGAPFYGLFGDHFRPLTKWSGPLEAAAGDWNIAWPGEEGSSPAGAVAFGGKLIAALGWICLPTSLHCNTEDPWICLADSLDTRRVVDGVRFTRTWPIGQGGAERPRYQNIDLEQQGSEAVNEWLKRDALAVVARVRAAMSGETHVG